MPLEPAPRGRAFRSRSGIALVTALLASTVLITLLIALLSSRIVELRNITGTVRVTQAQLIAEAGVDYVVGLAVRDDGVLPLESPCVHSAQDAFYCVSDVPYAGGSFDAWAVNDGGKMLVTSRAVDAAGTSRNLEVQFDLAIRNRIVSNFAVLTCLDLNLTGGLTVNDGDVYSGAQLSVSTENAVVNGDTLAYGDVTFTGSGSVTGNIVSETGYIDGGNVSKFRAGGYASNPSGYTTLDIVQTGAGVNNDPFLYDMPDYCLNPLWQSELEVGALDFADYEADALSNGPYFGNVHLTSSGMGGYATSLHHIDGNVTIDNMPGTEAFDGEVYYVTGDLTLNGSYNGNATFVVLGDVIVQGGAVIGGSDYDNAFIVDGNVRLAGGSTINGVVYTNGSVVGEGNSVVNGSVVAAGSGSVSGSMTVNYETVSEVLQLPNMYLDNVDVVRWRNVF